jgi:hypothetical protein
MAEDRRRLIHVHAFLQYTNQNLQLSLLEVIPV